MAVNIPNTRFPQLTTPLICSTDPAQIAAQSITEYEQDFLTVQGIKKTLAPGDPVRLLLLRSAFRESQFRNLINLGFQQNWILNAFGNNLDAIGSNYGSLGARLPATSAVTTLQFSIASPINVDVPIPATAGASTSSSSVATVNFVVNAATKIPAGHTSVSVLATCDQVGVIGNGYMAGQVNALTGYNLPFVVTVANTNITAGGAEIEADDAYAFRISLVPGAFSVAGSYQAYRYWAFTSSSAVADASIVGPPIVPAGTVSVYILLQNSVIPTAGVLSDIASFLNGTTLRPLTDTVNVLAPTVVNYNIVGTYFIDSANVNLQPTIDLAVQAVLPAYVSTLSSRIGRTVNPEYLGQLLMEAGASDYQLTQPARTILSQSQVAIQAGTMSMVYGGTQSP